MIQARDPVIKGSTMGAIMQNLPLPEGAALHFLNSLNGLRTPLLQDRIVFILTFLLGKKFSRQRFSSQLVLIQTCTLKNFILIIKKECMSNINF